MTSVLQLLTLPASSNGFSALPESIARDVTSGSSSVANQPIKIRVVGLESTNHPKATGTRILPRAIARILADDAGALPATYEVLYSECFHTVCDLNMGEDLYATLKVQLEQTCSQLAKKQLAEKSVRDADSAADWISAFVKSCQSFETQVGLLESLLSYLDQVYARRTQNYTVRQLAFSLFTRSIFENPRLMGTLRDSVTLLLQAERQLRMINLKTTDIPALVTQLYTYNQYPEFEEFYRDMTASYYEKLSQECADNFKDAPGSFFDRIQSLINEEVERSQKLLPVGSWGTIRDVTLQALLENRMQWIAQKTVGDYLTKRDFKNLREMNELFSEVDGSSIICDAFKTHVQKTVQSIVRNEEKDDLLVKKKDDSMVKELLDFHHLANRAIKSCFLEDPAHVANSSTSAIAAKVPRQEFVYALADAFTLGFKVRRNKPAEMIARHLDKLMRKGQGAQTDGEFEALLDQALGLYRFTDDKDVFRGFYLRALAKRLLLEKSASHDFEAAVLKKLKDEYDPEFNMGREMFSDLDLSRDMMAEYHSKLAHDSEGHKLSVMVLKQGAWPYSQQPQTVLLPPKMQEELNAFDKFYKGKHTGRTLHWQSTVGTVTLIGHFKGGKKELSVSMYQAAILLLFNDVTELALPEIAEGTQLEDSLLRLTLLSLACGKKRVLQKIPTGPDVNDGDVFRFNDAFTDSHAKVHINSIQAKVSVEESKQTQTAIDAERSSQLDAAIVRIMKAKKEMLYEKLIGATIDAVKNHFTPDVKTIKMRIDKLIEQEYVRRDEDQPSLFFYVA